MKQVPAPGIDVIIFKAKTMTVYVGAIIVAVYGVEIKTM